MPKASDLFVDTSGWAYYLDRQNPQNTVAVTVIQEAATQRRKLVTTSYIIHELVALLSLSRFRLSRKQVIEAINKIKADASVEVVYIERAIDDEAWKLLEERLDKEWSLVDAASFIVMNRYGMRQALTSDHHFQQAGFIKLL